VYRLGTGNQGAAQKEFPALHLEMLTQVNPTHSGVIDDLVWRPAG
jgi:hypothetical protein